jgi:hypothetical protein
MRRAKLFAALAALAALALGSACSNSEDAAPSRTVVPAGSSGSSGSTTSDAGDVDANVDPSCQGAEGCFKCEATRSIDILNSCTDGTCTPFDNTRLPLYVAGQPLPPIP